jgi:hypothetical protein
VTRVSALVAAALACTACSSDPREPGAEATSAAAPGCMAEGGGFLRARLRGAVVADLDWHNDDMQCDGGPRPDGKGLRVTFAGELPGSRRLRFIFGIDERDIAAGTAQAMPTNLTVILEGEQQIFGTRGSGQCAVESLQRTPLEETGGTMHRVVARGYCVGPATNAAGDARVLVPTFEFTGTAAVELE